MDPELIKKFFEGKCSPEEVHQVLLWINSEQGKQELGEDFEEFEVNKSDTAPNSQLILDKIHEEIGYKDISKTEKNTQVIRDFKSSEKKTRSRNIWKTGIAASFFVAIILSSISWFYLGQNQEEKVEKKVEPEVIYLTRQTMAGEKLTLKLQDGSSIQLNSNSKIKFPKSFSASSREVFMEGQAFFQVARDENRPFIVHSTDLITSVLGTSFAITEDVEKKVSQVAVLHGKVKVEKSSNKGSNETEELILEPMDAASFDSLKDSFKKIRVDYDRTFAWKDNVIVFHNSNFKEIQKRLENWFGVKFKLNKEIKDVRDYSGQFENQTLEDILIGLSFTFDFKFRIQDDVILIY